MKMKMKLSVVDQSRLVKFCVRVSVFVIIYVVFFQNNVFAGNLNADPHPASLINELKNYFDSYYSAVQMKGTYKSPEGVIKEIRTIVRKYLGEPDDTHLCGEANTLSELNCAIEEYLRVYGKSINIFIIEEEGVVNCWLGELIKDSSGKRNIWGQQIPYKIKIMDHLVINDFMSWATHGQDAYETGTQNGIVYLNFTAYRIRANETWDFLTRMGSGKFKKNYDSLKSNRLRKILMYKAWYGLYQDCVEQFNSVDEAKKVFIKRYIELKEQNSLAHESGHNFVSCSGETPSAVEEEMIAILTELRYGSAPYDSMDFLISTAWANTMSFYNLAGQNILNLMVKEIAGKAENDSFQGISVQGNYLSEKIRFLYQLSDLQIRKLGEKIFKQLKLLHTNCYPEQKTLQKSGQRSFSAV